MQKTRVNLIITILLLAGNIFFGFMYFSLNREFAGAKDFIVIQEKNEKVLDFTKLFISDVLNNEEEVNFETRLKLENSVRELKDEEVLSQWQKFTDSQTEAEAQENVKDLLEMLISKIK